MRSRDQGDTIVEIVLAFAIFSSAAVATMAVLNNGIAATQRNLEVTLVRQQVDTQAEMLRYLHDTQNDAWKTMISSATLVAVPTPLSGSCLQTSSINQGFYIQPMVGATPANTTFVRKSVTSSTYNKPSTYAKVDYSAGANTSQGIWMQVSRAQQQGGATSVTAYDFYIHACWDSVGVDAPMTAGTIVRIYD